MRFSSGSGPTLVALTACALTAGIQSALAIAADIVPRAYPAISNREVYVEPALLSLPPAGSRFTDPTFGARILRVTDAGTRPGSPNRSYSTPSAAHQLAWNATSDRFYIRSIDGWYIPYAFDPVGMRASRIQPSGIGDGGLTIASQVEPQFSFRSANVLFVSRQDPASDWPIIRQFDFNTLTHTDLLNLGNIPGGEVPQGTYAGALASSATVPEKLAVMYGGFQDSHYKVVVFEVGPPGANPIILNTQASTIRRGSTTTGTNLPSFNLHHVWLDQSGRYVLLYPVNQSPVPYYVWDLVTDVITAVTTHGEGHDATGFASQVNQSCCAVTAYDAAQWQYRTLSAPNSTSDLIIPVLQPQQVFLADHTSWSNAQPDAQVPILSGVYRYLDDTSNTTPWRAWDNEIIAIETSTPGSSGRVWRFAHHRSNVAWDGAGTAAVYFWYLPRPNISPNGRWALFTSNWEKTLGDTAVPEAGGTYRTDTFLVALTKVGLQQFTDDPLIPTETPLMTIHVAELRLRIDAQRARFGLMPYSWADPSLTGLPVRMIHLVDLRTALQEAYEAAARPMPGFTDPAIVAGVTMIKAVHIQELRDTVIDLELS